MQDVTVKVLEDSVRKYSTTLKGYRRLERELQALQALKKSVHTPDIREFSYKNNSISITMDRIIGEDAIQTFSIKEYHSEPINWNTAKVYIRQYIDAEMDLLGRWCFYRDLNLEHIIFSKDTVVLVDHESTIVNIDNDKWKLNDTRGTWETMAPEEFPGYGELNARTATYRTAVLAHIILTGKLPYKRFAHSRSATYNWRRKHPASIDSNLSKSVQRVFKSALARKSVHRYKNPESFFIKLTEAYDIK